MIHVNFRINLRALLRPMCWLRRGHDPMEVYPGDAFSRYFWYCRLCGLGWRRGNQISQALVHHRSKIKGLRVVRPKR